MHMTGILTLPAMTDHSLDEMAVIVSDMLPWATEVRVFAVIVPTVDVEAMTTDGIPFVMADPIGVCEVHFEARKEETLGHREEP